MKKYRIDTEIRFLGTFKVQANSKEEAIKIVQDNIFVMRGEIGCAPVNIFEGEDSEGIYNWDWPNHGELFTDQYKSKLIK